MKLKNKKTGEIVNDGYVRETHDFQFDGQKHVLAVFKSNGHRPPERVSGAYKSLAELNAEWEDYEEPKEFWYINEHNEPEEVGFGFSIDEMESLQEIGLLFETKEEAEKAVERFKAWKRLKDKGFEFEWVDKDIGSIKFAFFNREGKITKEMWQDIDLLFGGEE